MAVMSLRLDDDQTEKLRLYRALTGRVANEVVAGLVREFFESKGDAEIAEAMTRLGRSRPAAAGRAGKGR